MTKAPLVACHDCDLLQSLPALEPGEQARCIRCGAKLMRRPYSPVDHTLAYAIAALVTFVLGNCYPVVLLQTQGLQTQATLLSAVRALQAEGMNAVGALVFFTGFLAPLVLLLSLIYLLMPLQMRRIAPGFAQLFRLFLAVSPWAMIEVMMLGVVVSFVKLANMATAVSGLGLWAFGLTMLLMAAMSSSMDHARVWRRYEALQRGRMMAQPA